MDDDELLRELRGNGPRHEEAIAYLRCLLLRGLTKSLNNRYGKPFSAEDVVQDALLKILDSLEQFEGRSKFTTWAMTIATRVGISALRRKHHADLSLDAFSDREGAKIELAVAAEDELLATQVREELMQKLNELVENALTIKQRQVIRAVLEGFSTDGIATQMDMNRNAVYKLLHDARVKLKREFEVAGYHATDVLSAIAGANS